MATTSRRLKIKPYLNYLPVVLPTVVVLYSKIGIN